ncbi:unnamed protein product [Caenorhabditis angaria]|uniref:DUF38 domain-containing protein n=1 Tax=Caenorhabditis angaria TaxID=860376 RepID=A0A9P1IBG5_9PELO|nr:unnamed protein product [Caenorhabditis angaria]
MLIFPAVFFFLISQSIQDYDPIQLAKSFLENFEKGDQTNDAQLIYPLFNKSMNIYCQEFTDPLSDPSILSKIYEFQNNQTIIVLKNAWIETENGIGNLIFVTSLRHQKIGNSTVIEYDIRFLSKKIGKNWKVVAIQIREADYYKEKWNILINLIRTNDVTDNSDL